MNSDATVRHQSYAWQATSLFGRSADIERLRADILYGDARLVTLTGPGGVGKTQLALAVAASVATEFEHGMVVVDLSSVQHPDHVPSAMARALGMDDAGPDPLLGTLRWLLADRHLLMVVDNFEHLLTAVPVLDAVLRACPAVQMLVTSRAPLRLRWEYVRPVPPLALPPRPTEHEHDRQALLEIPSVALLVQRAHAVAAGLVLNAPNYR